VAGRESFSDDAHSNEKKGDRVRGVVMGKSTPTKRLLIRTTERHESYQAAWNRMFLAMREGFFLEAIAIQESILTDRLSCFLDHCKIVDGKKRVNFRKLIEAWKAHFPGPLAVKREPDLQSAIDEWRNHRNSAVHGFVKDAPVDEFLRTAKLASERGMQLTSYLCEWCAKELRKQRKLIAS
jgi:hypothetical protein